MTIKHLNTLGAAFLLCLLLCSCASDTKGRTANPQKLYERRCARCHDLFAPSDFADDEWPELVRRYAPRAGIRPSLRPSMIAWLQANN